MRDALIKAFLNGAFSAGVEDIEGKAQRYADAALEDMRDECTKLEATLDQANHALRRYDIGTRSPEQLDAALRQLVDAVGEWMDAWPW